MLVEDVCHDSTQHGVAQILEAFVVDAMAMYLSGEGAMGEGNTIQPRVSRSVSKDVFKEVVEFLAFVVFAEEKHAG